jgi:cephalosporin-C deacetylase-like acetyl esterase
MGHSRNGKAYDSYQKCCQGLARLGYLVLAFDPMGQGERSYYPKPGSADTRLDSSDEEHTLPGRQLLLVGATVSQVQVWDAVRSLDVLAAHPLVDPARLASAGQSGGATLTMMLAAVDERLAAAVVSSGNTENFACAGFIAPGSTDDAEQNLIDSGPPGFDRWDLLYPLAPKPLLIEVSARDFFGTYSPQYLASGRTEFVKLKQVYTALGFEDRVAWIETPTPHGLSYFLRTRIYMWLERWLHGRDARELAEPPVEPEREEVLRVGASGNTITDFRSRTPLGIARDRAAALHPAPVDASRLQDLLRLETGHSGNVRELGRVVSESADIAAIDVETVPRVRVPGWLYLPKTEVSKTILLIAEPQGRNARWGEGGLYHQLAARGVTVCAMDVRGCGDLSPEVGRGSPQYELPHASEEAYSWASLILGRPLVGQRVTDLAGFAAALARMNLASGKRIVLAAAGKLAVPALCAAALERSIAGVYLAAGLASFHSLLQFEEYRQTTANFLPGILAQTDLPQIAALAAPRRIVIAGAVDGREARLNATEVRELYKDAENVEIRSEALWDADSLAAF